MKIQQIAPCNKVTSCKTDPKYYAPTTSYGSACRAARNGLRWCWRRCAHGH